MEVKVPDIGDFDAVPVIEILVAVGDEVGVEDPLVVLESDKATMEVPSPAAGKVTDITVAVGDKVGEGTPLLTLETADAAPAEAASPPEAPAKGYGDSPGEAATPEPPATSAAPASSGPPDDADVKVQVVVLGAGPGGYTAAFRAADLGLSVALVDRGERLGGVCLNVGCIPSKALLHVAKVLTEAEEMSESGVSFGKPTIDIDHIRAWKNDVVGRLTGGLDGLAKQRKVQVVRGVGEFTSPNTIKVGDTGRRLRALHHRGGLGGGLAALPARRPADHGLHGRAGGRGDPRPAARHRRRDHRPGDGDGLRRARLQGHGRRVARPADPRRGQGPHPRPGEAHQGPLRGDPPLHRRRVGRGDGGRPEGQVRRHDRDLRPHPRRRRPAPERQGDRRRGGGRGRRRARLHRVRRPDAHERSAHLLDRRRPRRADARPQGHARRRAGRRGDRGRGRQLGRALDPERRLHRPRGRVDRPHRDPGQGRGDRVRGRRVPVGGLGPRA